MQPLNEIERITQDPAWIAVEQEIEAQLCSLLDIRNIDTNLGSTAFKIELLARRRAGEKLLEFYNKHKFSKRKLDEVVFNFR